MGNVEEFPGSDPGATLIPELLLENDIRINNMGELRGKLLMERE